jgi:hypothetical protein
MNISKFLRKYHSPIQLSLSLCVAVLTAIYVNLLTSIPRQGSLIGTIPHMGWSNLWGISALVAFYLQIRTFNLDKPSKNDKEQALNSLLEAAARSIIYPRNLEKLDIRIFCHLADTENKVLKPICKWSLHFSEDFSAPIPYEGTHAEYFVISKSYKRKEVIAEELPYDHNKLYPDNISNKIKPTMKCIIAAPVCNFDDDAELPLGTVALDSSKTLRETGFSTQEAKDIIKLIAECVYFLIR